MNKLIECVWYNTKYSIGLLSNGDYIYKIDNKINPVVKEVHCGSIHYRIVGSSKRVSSKKLNNKQDIILNYKLQDYCPF